MKFTAFSSRTTKEILRDPLTLVFGLGFPLILLLLMSAIQSKIPVELFSPEVLTPGITVFGMSFMTLFSAMLISKDRAGALLIRLFSTPLTPWDFILGYTLPLIPIAIIQSTICYITAFALGLEISSGVILAIIAGIPTAVFYISLGLFLGTLLNDKQVGGICGALLTNLSAWLSGVWFDLSLIGGAFEKIAHILPFYHAVEIGRSILTADHGDFLSHFIPVCIYAVIFSILAVVAFFMKMKDA